MSDYMKTIVLCRFGSRPVLAQALVPPSQLITTELNVRLEQ